MRRTHRRFGGLRRKNKIRSERAGKFGWRQKPSKRGGKMFDSLSRIRLQWMFDNEPERVKELLDKNRLLELEKNLLVSVIPAIDLMAPKTRHELYGGARGGARIPDTEGRPGVQRRP